MQKLKYFQQAGEKNALNAILVQLFRFGQTENTAKHQNIS
jgi:hypothetical protein